MINSTICNILDNKIADINIQECFDEIFSGLCDEVLSGIFLTLLKTNNENIEDIIAGITSARNAIKRCNLDIDYDYAIENICLNKSEKYLDISFAMDIISSANDIGAVKTSPLNCFYKNNSFETLSAFGVDIEKLTNDNCEKNNFIYNYINQEIHPYLKYTQNLFRILPFESILNTINIFLNPYNVKNCTVALCDKSKVEDFANICLSLGYVNSVIFSAGDFPYVSIEGETAISEAWKNKIFSYTISPELLEIKQNSISSIEIENYQHGSEIIQAVFENKLKDSFYDAIVINSALALYIVKRTKSLLEGLNLAKQTIDSGLALERLNSIKNTF